MRCWYTLDGNGHKLLARSPGKCSVTTLKGFPPASNFAKTRLRPCLDFICRSSPELLHDPSRDYAVYILDPTEAAAAPSAALAAVGGSSSGEGEVQGVAVGLGLVSTLTTDSYSTTPAVGTIVTSPSGEKSLELVFTFRGVRSLPLPHFIPLN